MEFGEWYKFVDVNDEDFRLDFAMMASPSQVEVDHENKTMKFYGTSEKPYIVSLEKCSCMDFHIKRFPCKHMFRLAIELGLIDTSVKIQQQISLF